MGKPKWEPPRLTGWLIGKPEPKVEQHDKSFESFDTDRVTDRMSCEGNSIRDEKLEDKLDDVAMLLKPCVEMRSVRNVENTTPSVFNWVKDADQSKVACAFKRGGYCTTHKVKAKKILVTSTKWKDRGGGRGYGNVTSKVTKYICNGVNDTRKLFNIPVSREV